MNKAATETNPSKQDLFLECRDFFDDKWQLYQKVLLNNYMKHQESYQVVKSLLQNSKISNFSLLDLGCGDASFISQALQGTNVRNYLGLDISQTAIQIAHQNISRLSCQYTFIEGDILSTIYSLKSTDSSDWEYDFIISSFAFHHFSSQQKEQLFHQIANLLSADGKFILIDFLLKETETRDNYINNYLKYVKHNWQALTKPEINLITEHMWNSDYPETQTNLMNMSIKSGFRKSEFLSSNQDLAQVCCFSF